MSIYILVKEKDFKSIKKIIQTHKSDLIIRNKVRRTGIGYKIKDGKITDEVGILIFVRWKPTIQTLLDQKIEPVPKEIDGYKTDVINLPLGFTPRISRLLTSTVLPDDLRHRPFEGGCAIINATGEPATGTLGLIVKKSSGNSDKLFLITNNHVGANEDVEGLSPPGSRNGDPITQPGAHGGGQDPQDTIAVLDRWNRLKPHAPGIVNFYDFSMAEITPEARPFTRPYQVMDIGDVKGVKEINLGDSVLKRGRTTRKTIGKVVAVSVETSVDYRGIPCGFEDQVVIVGVPEATPFSLAGDSGSVIVSKVKDPSSHAHQVEALLFAGGTTAEGLDFTLGSPIMKIVQDFELDI
jgi:hypothetical protein